MAANHAKQIARNFAVDGYSGTMPPGRLTRNGEARIKKCIKFDLVYGYRLLGIMREDGIKFAFVGSHDECDLWIRNNSGLEPFLKKKDIQVPGSSPAGVIEAREPQCASDEPDYDELVLRDITDQDLRIIFRGLCAR